MTFIAESKVSSAACAMYYSAGDDIDLSVGYTVKPQSVKTWGKSGNWSYNSTTGLFSLSNSHNYLIEADLYVGKIKGAAALAGSVISMLTDGSGNEIADSCRGLSMFLRADTYYDSFRKVTDQTNFAVVDGASVTSFYWKVESIELDTSSTIRLNYTEGNGEGTYGVCDSRLVIREYPK